MTALRLIQQGSWRLATGHLVAAWKRYPVWTGWLPLLSCILLALCSGRVYSPPIPLTDVAGRAEQLLEQLRPPDIANPPLAMYKVLRRYYHPHPVDQGHWEIAFLAPDASHLYRLTLTREGRFRAFAVYRRTPVAETAPAHNPRHNSATASAMAEAWRAFLLREAGIAPPPTVELPPAVRESPFPGHVREIIRRWKTTDPYWPFVEVAVEGTALQSLRLIPQSPPDSFEDKDNGGLPLALALALVLWLPWSVVFVRGIFRGLMGSLTVLIVASILGIPFLVWLSTVLGFTIAAPLAWREPVITESEFLRLSNTSYWVSWLLLLLATAGLASLGIWLLGLISLAVTESYDWKRQRQLLGDVYRLFRRKSLPAGQVARFGRGGLAWALWVLVVETVVAWWCGRPTLPWHSFSSWSRELAVGHWPGWQIIGSCFVDIWFVTICLLPLAAFTRDRFQDPSAALTTGFGAWMVGLPLVIGSGATLVGYTFLLGGLLWTLFNHGWTAVVFGYALVGGLFPLLWSLRFPQGFEPLFLVGSVALLPLMVFVWGQRRSPRARPEAFDLAPPYVRDRLRRERWREDLDVRWLIHSNLLPPSGFRDEKWRVVAEYAHLPEQGREWFAILPLTERHIGLAIGEVSGEGLEASLLMAATLTALKSKAVRSPSCPVQVVARLSEFLSPRLQSLDAQIRLLYGIADVHNRVFTYCNAGYVPPAVLAPGKDGIRHPVSRPAVINPPLHSATSLRFRGDTFQLASGSYLVLMSDWLGELFGLAPDAEELVRHNEKLVASFWALPATNLPSAIVCQGGEQAQQLFGRPAKLPSVEITVVCLEF